jgi:hypothetical protein
MENVNFEEKLTPAAREALNEMVDNYRSKILIEAGEYASRLSGEVHEISVSDIMNSIGKNLQQSEILRRSKIDAVLSIYIILGLLMTGTSLLYFFLGDIFEKLTYIKRLAILISIAGFVIAIVSYAISKYRQYKTIYGEYYSYVSTMPTSEYFDLFIRKWQQIEISIRALAASLFGESIADEPISMLVKRLTNSGKINDNDSKQILEILFIRNKLVHKATDVPLNNLRNATRDADHILSKLKSG